MSAAETEQAPPADEKKGGRKKRDPQTQTKNVVGDLAAEAGVSIDDFWAAMQRIAGSKDSKREDFVALVIMAGQYGLNPLRREIGLMDTSQGPRVYVSSDGWTRVLTSHPDYMAHDVVEHWSGPKDLQGTCDGVTIRIWSKKRKAEGMGPFEWRELLRECLVPPRKRREGGGDILGPWQTHPVRMLKMKALGQACRFLWNMYLPTEDEFERMDEVAERPVQTGAAAKADMKPVLDLPMQTVSCEVIDLNPHDVIDANRVRTAVTAGSQDDDRVRAAPMPVPAAKPTLPQYSPEESRRVDALIAEKDNRTRKGGPDDDDLDLGI